MLVLALVFLVVLVAPLVVDLPAAARTAFSAADLAIWPAFAVDYGVRLYLAPARWHFVRTHPLDLIVLALPMLRPLRALRLLRPARLGAIAGVAHRRAQRSLHATVAGYVTTSAAGVLVLAAAVMYDVERRAPAGNIKSFPDALRWAVTTVTTVGYGDRYATTGAGRLVGGALMLAASPCSESSPRASRPGSSVASATSRSLSRARRRRWPRFWLCCRPCTPGLDARELPAPRKGFADTVRPGGASHLAGGNR